MKTLGVVVALVMLSSCTASQYFAAGAKAYCATSVEKRQMLREAAAMATAPNKVVVVCVGDVAD